MSNLNRQITVDELDFDGIKGALKDFLRGQSNFTDFEFEGSAMSVLLDILAYNTHYNALYTNLAINEMFIDSASKLSSVTSLAKTIGYTPRSRLAAVAKLNVVVTNVPNLVSTGAPPSYLTMPKGTAFKSEVNDTEYTFLTTGDVTAALDPYANSYTYTDIEVVQGEALQQSYLVSDISRFVVPITSVDMTRLTVRVFEAPGNTAFEVFNKAVDVLRITSTDPVYFIKQREDLLYEIFFGNNAIGKKLNNGNIVVIDYYSTKADEANGCSAFTYAGGWMGDYAYSVSTSQVAQDGAVAEDLESIKYNAPRFYKSQHRAITSSDYEVILKQHNPLIESVKVWGGEDNIPPIYGKVFISAKPISRDVFLASEKDDMIKWLRENRSVLTVLPEFVDASILNLEITSSVYYDPTLSVDTPDTIRNQVFDAISAYAADMNRFNKNFLYSNLVGVIDATHPAITNNILKLRVRNTIIPYNNVIYKHVINYANPIRNNGAGGNVWSTRFYSHTDNDRVYFRDESDGSIWLYTEDIYGVATKTREVGSVDYEKGIVTFEMYFRAYYDGIFEIVFEPESYDLLSVNNYIISIPMNKAEISVLSSTSNITASIR